MSKNEDEKMEHPFRALILQSLGDADLPIGPAEGRNLDLNSPASDVLIDFRKSRPLVIEHDTTVDDALALMKRAHVDLKQVVDKDEQFVGIVAREQLEGDAVLRKVSVTGIPRTEMTIDDIMIGRADLHAISLAQLEASRVGDIVETMRDSGEEFIVVVNPTGTSICGVFWSKAIARALHSTIDILARATTLADVHDLLEHHVM